MMFHMAHDEMVKGMSGKKLIEAGMLARWCLEERLVKALYAEFGRGRLYEDVRYMLFLAMWELTSLSRQSDYWKPLLWKLENRQQNDLEGLRLYGGTAEKVWEHLVKGARPSLKHCADLIRFFGKAVVELSQPQHSAQPGWSDLRKWRVGQLNWRYGGGGQAWKASRSDTEGISDLGSVWQTNKGLRTAKKRRLKLKKYAGARARECAPGQRFEPFPGLFPFPWERVERRIGAQAGARRWKAKSDSTVAKMARVFGVPYYADISGTTGNTMQILDAFDEVMGGQLDPLIRMLPLATIPEQHHHSVLEVALPMSIPPVVSARKIIDYKIGFYSTLLPKKPDGVPAHPQRHKVEGLLNGYDIQKANNHILIYYLRNTPAIGGCYVLEPGEFAAFKRIATCDIGLWPRFNAIRDYPYEWDILRLLFRAGLYGTECVQARLRDLSSEPLQQKIAGYGLVGHCALKAGFV